MFGQSVVSKQKEKPSRSLVQREGERRERERGVRSSERSIRKKCEPEDLFFVTEYENKNKRDGFTRSVHL